MLEDLYSGRLKDAVVIKSAIMTILHRLGEEEKKILKDRCSNHRSAQGALGRKSRSGQRNIKRTNRPEGR
jgi:hypothetical protein